MGKVRVWKEPERRLGSVTLHPRWMVDNGSVTAGADRWQDALNIAVYWATGKHPKLNDERN